MDIDKKLEECKRKIADIEAEIQRANVCTPEQRESIDSLDGRKRWYRFRGDVENGSIEWGTE